jgi:hypothetical protein
VKLTHLIMIHRSRAKSLGVAEDLPGTGYLLLSFSWIDALCINQEDINERETQVMQMGDIYKCAHRVVVWLGSSFVNSHLAISALEFIGKQIEATKNDWVYQSPGCTERQWFHARYVLPYTEKVWHATQTLLESPWFQRIWIVQEIQLANERCMMICGDKEISWYLFRRSIVLLFGKRNHLPETLRPLIERVAEFCRTLTNEPLQALLIVARRNLCKEPVDKIFGILGLTSPIFASKARPNYSLSASEVYKSIFLEQSFLLSRLEMLASCDSRVPRMIGLPSWVPDWSVDTGETMRTYGSFVTTGYSSSRIKYLPSGVLEVVGIECCTVSLVSNTLDTTQDLADLARGIGS